MSKYAERAQRTTSFQCCAFRYLKLQNTSMDVLFVTLLNFGEVTVTFILWTGIYQNNNYQYEKHLASTCHILPLTVAWHVKKNTHVIHICPWYTYTCSTCGTHSIILNSVRSQSSYQWEYYYWVNLNSTPSSDHSAAVILENTIAL